MSGLQLTGRQRALIEAAEKIVDEAKADLAGAEDTLREAQCGLKAAERELRRVCQMGNQS